MTFNYNYFCHVFVLIYIVYRRWRCVRFLECIYKTRYIWVPYRHYHAIINLFYLNALVRTCYYQFGLFTLSLLLFKIFIIYSRFYFGLELSFKWPYWPKNDVEKIFYLLTYPCSTFLRAPPPQISLLLCPLCVYLVC